MAEASADPTDRLGAAFRTLVRLTFPSLRFFGVFEYEVIQGTAGPTMQARCTDPGLNMPDLPPTKLYPGVDGSNATWPTGTKFLVGFINGDPTRPYAIGGDPTQTPTNVTIPATAQVSIAGGGNTLVPTPWATSLVLALTNLATALAAVTSLTSPPPTSVQAAGAALATALGALPSAATTKTVAT